MAFLWRFFRRPGCVLGVSTISVLYSAALLLSVQRHFNQPDFSQYYVYAYAMRKGLNPYIVDLTPLAQTLHLSLGWTRAAYSPTFILCFEPLTLLSPFAAYWTWTAINVAFFSLALFLLLDEFDLSGGLLLAALAIFYAPVTSHFHFAQTQILVLLLLTLAMRAVKNGHDAVAGATLALAGLLRVFPLIMVGYLLVCRKWFALLSMGLVLAAGVSVTSAFLGFGRTLSFLQLIFPLSQQLRAPVAISLPAAISRMFWLFKEQPSELLDLVRRITVLIACLFVVALTIRATATRNRVNTVASGRVFGLWVVTMVLITPTAWPHYMVLLLLPFALLASSISRGDSSSRTIWLGVGSYTLTEVWMVPLNKMPISETMLNGLTELGALWLALEYVSSYFLATDRAADQGPLPPCAQILEQE
jgi:Glycosyltransferase family 87